MAKAAAKKTASSSRDVDKKNSSTDFKNFAGASRVDATLQQFFLSELKDIYWAENHLTKALPKMIASASSDTLRKALTNHLTQTVDHVSRMQQIFELIGAPAVAKKCDAMEGLTISGEHVIENTLAGTPVRDLGLMMFGLKVEHFEITAYTGLIQVATTLGLSEVADLLQQNLDEEVAAAEKLSEVSHTTAIA